MVLDTVAVFMSGEDVRSLPTSERYIVTMNEPISMQIGTRGPQGKGMQWSSSGLTRSKVKGAGGRS